MLAVDGVLAVGGDFLTVGSLVSPHVVWWNLNCPVGDLDLDGSIDGFDLAMMLGSWSVPPGSPGCGGAPDCQADLNNDGVVDGYDLALLLAAWG